MGGRVWTLTQTDETLWYHVYNNQDKQKEGSDRKRRAGVSVLDKNTAEKRFKCAPEKEEDEPLAVSSVQNRELDEEMLRDYFQLNVRMGDLHKEWGAADCHFKHIAEVFKGQCVSLCLHSLATTYHLLHSKVLLKYYVLSNFINTFLWGVFLQVCECCARTPQNACFPLFALPTTTSLGFRAWWTDCVRLWVHPCASLIRPHTTTFLPCLRLQVLENFATELKSMFVILSKPLLSDEDNTESLKIFIPLVFFININ